MSTHTPGPWRLGDDGGDSWYIAAGDSDDLICVGVDCFANVRLIAAAPDLLEAVKDLRDELASLKWGQPFPGRPHAMLDAADAAIAKATGEA